MTGFQLKGAKTIFKLVKKISPSTYTIFGGVHPSMLPDQSIKEDFVDFLVIGEGESTIVELINELKKEIKDFKKIKGIVWKYNKKIIFNELRNHMNMDDLVFPLTDKNKKYFEYSAQKNEIFYFSSRGCPFSCRFCYNKFFNKGIWRPMKIEKLEKEIDELISKLDTKFDYMFLNDDWIGNNIKRLKEIGRIFSKYNIKWGTCIRCSDLNEEVVKILDSGGCRQLLLGVESGSERILNKVIGKKYAEGIDDIKNATKVLNQSNIKATYGFIVNIPTETKKDLKKSIALADWIHKHDKNSRISFYVYAPYPGTELYKDAVKNGFKEPQSFDEWSKISLSSEVNPFAENLYYISGLKFRGGKGDSTSKNFKGIKRLKILPFEIIVHLRWKLRFFTYFNFEKKIIKKLIFNATKNN